MAARPIGTANLLRDLARFLGQQDNCTFGVPSESVADLASSPSARIVATLHFTINQQEKSCYDTYEDRDYSDELKNIAKFACP